MNENINIKDEITKWQKLLLETHNQITLLSKKKNTTQEFISTINGNMNKLIGIEKRVKQNIDEMPIINRNTYKMQIHNLVEENFMLNRTKDKCIKTIKEELEMELFGKEMNDLKERKKIKNYLNEKNSLDNSSRLVEEIRSEGENIMSNMKSQSEQHKGIYNRLIDMGSSLGLSYSTLQMVERRDFGDKLLGLLGMFLVIVILFFIFYYKFYK
jgi:hypothetical protein